MNKICKKVIVLTFFFPFLGLDLYAEAVKSMNYDIVLFVFAILLGINCIPIAIYFFTKKDSRVSIALRIFSGFAIFANLFVLTSGSMTSIQNGIMIALIGLEIYFLFFYRKRVE